MTGFLLVGVHDPLAGVPSRADVQPAAGSLSAQQSGDELDALYARREDLDAARRAAEAWSLRAASDFTSAWKAARARYWLGGHTTGADVRRQFESGASAARQAIALQPGRPEGHFWLAANLGALAETQGGMTGLRVRKEIKRELEQVLALDPAFQDGSADRALGRWYLKVPRLFGGSRSRSEMHLRRSLTYNPNSTASLYFLAETLLADDRPREAADVLRKLQTAPLHPDWTPEDREFKRKGQELLRSLAP